MAISPALLRAKSRLKKLTQELKAQEKRVKKLEADEKKKAASSKKTKAAKKSKTVKKTRIPKKSVKKTAKRKTKNKQ